MRAREPRRQTRYIGDHVENACATMFKSLPAAGDTYRSLWKEAFARARRELRLRDSLDVPGLSPRHLEGVCEILDDVFAEGTLLRYISRKGRPLKVSIAEKPDGREKDAAMYLDSGTNTLVLVRPTWKRRMPSNAEMDGVRVRNKLEWLCRMVAHELCHSMANVACGMTCAKMAANHGPVFNRLNHSIFGHPGSKDPESENARDHWTRVAG